MGFFEAGFVGPQHIEFLITGPQDAPHTLEADSVLSARPCSSSHWYVV